MPRHRDRLGERSALILQVLRQKARASRNKTPEEFYSIREVASHFEVPNTTVSRIYTQLKAEGLLTTVWGSKTFIAPTQIDNDMRIRGAVALPASLVSFCTLRQYRNFFSEIRDALWKFGFASQLLFHEENGAQSAEFAELLLRQKPHVVIWFLPILNCKQTVARLLDHGIRVITVADSARDAREHLYHVDRERAIRDTLLNWRRNRIDYVTVLQNSRCRWCGILTLLEKCLRDTAMQYRVADLESVQLDEAGAMPAQQVSRGIIFGSSETIVSLLTRDPARFAQLSQRSRTLMLEGPIDAPGLSTTTASSDVLELDTRLIVKTIVSDLIGPTRARSAAPVIFHAKWLPRSIETLTPKRLALPSAMLKRHTSRSVQNYAVT